MTKFYHLYNLNQKYQTRIIITIWSINKLYFNLELYIKDNINKVKNKEEVNRYGQMVRNISECGSIIKQTDQEY